METHIITEKELVEACKRSDRGEPEPPFAGAQCSADLDMMKEWASSLRWRLPTMDLHYAEIALEWFYSYAKSHIKRTEELRAIEAASKLSPPNVAGELRPPPENQK